MIAEFGHFCLIFALVIFIVQGYYGITSPSKGNIAGGLITRRAAIAGALLCICSFISLTICYVISDFSVLNVAENSHTLKPLIYKISGVWGNHEGSITLWLVILAIYNAAIVFFTRNSKDNDLVTRAIGIQGLISVGFALFIVFASNPFERLLPAPIEGNSLNPLLQDPILAIHPPLLYIGYVGFSVAYSFAIAALISGKIGKEFATLIRPWILFAWTSLGAGIALGSWWAYYELGWGGWWFWDPVENASLLPWLTGIALIHCLIVMEKREALIKWVIFLSISSFILSILGTFLVRSGVLTSVHAFAIDPERGIFILSLLFIYCFAGYMAFALKSHHIGTGKSFRAISREGALVINNLFIMTGVATIIIGTLYPLILSSLNLGQISVGAPYFNSTFVPLMIPMILLMGVGSFLPWKKTDLRKVKNKLLSAFIICAIASSVMSYIYMDSNKISAYIGFAIGFWLISCSIIDIKNKASIAKGNISTSIKRIINAGYSFWGMIFAHAGLGIAIIGMVGASILNSDKIEVIKKNSSTHLAGYEFIFKGTEIAFGANYNSDVGNIEVHKNGEKLYNLTPEKRFYPAADKSTTETSIKTNLYEDIYVALGEPVDKSGNSWIIRIYHHPLIIYLWIGFISIIIGGALSFCAVIRNRRYN